MEMLAKVTIRGAKYFVGNIDGKDFDSGSIYVDVVLRGETASGLCTEEQKVEKADIVKAILHNPMPFVAELTMVETTTGKSGGARRIVTAIKPLGLEPKGGKVSP